MSHFIHRVEAVKRLSPSIFELLLDREEMSFEVGNCVALFDATRRESRPYSLAGGINEPVLRVLFRALPEGVVTSHLKQLKQGDELQVSAPFGWFRPGQDDSNSPCIFIATSTGISPFLSYVRSFPDRPPAHILYGVRYLAEAVGLPVLKAACPVTLAISREAVPGYHHGRVTDLLDRLPIRKRTQIYLCGLDAMIDDASSWLEAHGVPFTHLHREVFFYANARPHE